VADFECVTAPRSEALDIAHKDPRVQAAADAFLQAPVREMVKLLRLCLYHYYPPNRHRTLILDAGIATDQHAYAYEMIAATNAIYGMDPGTPEEPGPRTYARGAVIERIAEVRLRIRRPGLLSEQCIGPFDKKYFKTGMSNPIDFFAPETPQEFWDAKSSMLKVKGPQVHQLNLLLGMADYGSVAGYVTLWEREVVVGDLMEFANFEAPLYAYCFENFELMSEELPKDRVDANAP
jgi:hypothetical protein